MCCVGRECVLCGERIVGVEDCGGRRCMERVCGSSCVHGEMCGHEVICVTSMDMCAPP